MSRRYNKLIHIIMYFSVSSRRNPDVGQTVSRSVRDYHESPVHHDDDQEDLLDVSFFFISLSLYTIFLKRICMAAKSFVFTKFHIEK